jgi:hypothetical protein
MSRNDDDTPPVCGTFTAAGGEWTNRTGTRGKQPEPPPDGPPPAWQDSRRQDPCVDGAFTCHHCLDAGQVWNVDRATATMIAVTCSCATGSAG